MGTKWHKWKVITKAVATIGAIGAGMALGGNMLYKQGMMEGGSRVYDAAANVYEDFPEKMAEYASREETDENEKEDS